MLTRRSALLACGAAILGLAIATSSHAAFSSPRTNHLTFSGPVGLPGVTLAGGTYTFEVLPGHPTIVRVSNPDGSRVYFTGFARSIARSGAAGRERLVTFAETPRGIAPRIRAWYPLDARAGYAFVYRDVNQ
jgi:hypothetical protein